MSADESEEAFLVRPQSPSLAGLVQGAMPYTDGPSTSSTSRPSQPRVTFEHDSGLQSINSYKTSPSDLDDDIILGQFHTDAIKQAGCGQFQATAVLICGLALSGHVIQLYAIPYILPSAEVEFCIADSKKNWLSAITIVGLGVGALFLSGLAARIGRRKALVSCLVVSCVFSVIAAFMPTYGPFMMARFCAAMGVGGILPAASTYLWEFSPINFRTRVLCVFGSVGCLGGLLAGGIAVVTVPSSGQAVVLDNKEHFSAWHRYLLLIALPNVLAIALTLWMPESPRFLLQNSREVEALEIYQKIYRKNRARGGYSLTELELPAMRVERSGGPTSVLMGMKQNFIQFLSGYKHLFSRHRCHDTCLLFLSWLVSVLVFHGLSVFTGEYVKSIEMASYNRRTVRETNLIFENHNFNQSIDNTVYHQSQFINCTFRRIFMSHVTFENCTFIQSEFSNVKTSHTLFLDSYLQDIKFIDTDLTKSHFVNCEQNNLSFLGLPQACNQDFDYNLYMGELWKSHLYSLVPIIVLLPLLGEIAVHLGRCRTAVFCYFLAFAISVVLAFVRDQDHIVVIGGLVQALVVCGLSCLAIAVRDSFSASLGCVAVGFFLFGGQIGALLGSYLFAVPSSCVAVSVLSCCLIAVPLLVSGRLKDPPPSSQ